MVGEAWERFEALRRDFAEVWGEDWEEEVSFGDSGVGRSLAATAGAEAGGVPVGMAGGNGASGYDDAALARESARVLGERGYDHEERMRERRESIWQAWALAIRTQFRMDIPQRDLLAMMGVVVRLELTLIMYFGDSVPTAGVAWTSEQRHRETQRRLSRLGWLLQQQERSRAVGVG